MRRFQTRQREPARHRASPWERVLYSRTNFIAKLRQKLRAVARCTLDIAVEITDRSAAAPRFEFPGFPEAPVVFRAADQSVLNHCRSSFQPLAVAKLEN